MESPSTAGNTKGPIYFEKQKRTTEDTGRGEHLAAASCQGKRPLAIGGFNLNEQLTQGLNGISREAQLKRHYMLSNKIGMKRRSPFISKERASLTEASERKKEQLPQS